MRKLLMLFIILLMLAFVGCDEQDKDSENKTDNSSENGAGENEEGFQNGGEDVELPKVEF